MNWKQAAIEDLKSYEAKKLALENLQQRYRLLRERAQSIQAACTDRIPVQGGGSQYEDSLVNNLDEQRRIRENYRIIKRELDIIQRGLSVLDRQERLVLERFYIQPDRYHVQQLADELHRDPSSIYRLKDAALHKFTLALYGLTEK